MQKKQKAIIYFSNAGYVTGCVILYIIAFCIIISAVWSIINDVLSSNFTVYNLLDEVALIVFSIAVIDVARYLMIEEVLRLGEERAPAEERRALTKFAVIISTALSLEGLVLTIETAKTNVEKIYFPVSVLITAILMIVGLGVYQKLNSSAEK